MRGSLTQKIDDLIYYRREQRDAERAEKHPDGRDGFYASEIGGCFRKVAYDFYKIEKAPKDARSLRVFENGEVLQGRYSQYFKDLGVWVDEEHSINTTERADVPFLLYGRTDIVINEAVLFGDENTAWTTPMRLASPQEVALGRGIIYDDGKHYILDWAALEATPEIKNDLAIIEMKSINTYGFKDIAKALQPETAHYLQLQTYMWLTGIHKGWIVYEDKNDQTICEIPVEYDERVIYGTSDGKSRGILQELSELGAMLDQHGIPARCPEAKADGFPCKWKNGGCDFYAFCWNPEHNGEYIEGITPVNAPEPEQVTDTTEQVVTEDGREIIWIGELAFYHDELLEVMTDADIVNFQNMVPKFGLTILPKLVAKSAISNEELDAMARQGELAAAPAQTEAAPAPAPAPTPTPAPAANRKPSIVGVANRNGKPATITQPPAEVGNAVQQTAADVQRTQTTVQNAAAAHQLSVEEITAKNTEEGFATEFVNADGNRAVYCIKCGTELPYKRLANGNTIKCTKRTCEFVNPVRKIQ